MSVPFKVGTMIEVPRAALMAGSIAATAEFFSFGTNDLTQMTYGYSRDDVGKFLPVYLEKGILQYDPFQVRDTRMPCHAMPCRWSACRQAHMGLQLARE